MLRSTIRVVGRLSSSTYAIHPRRRRPILFGDCGFGPGFCFHTNKTILLLSMSHCYSVLPFTSISVPICKNFITCALSSFFSISLPSPHNHRDDTNFSQSKTTITAVIVDPSVATAAALSIHKEEDNPEDSTQPLHAQCNSSTTTTIVDAYSAIELALDSVVKIFTVSSSPNYFLPWQNKSQRETMGSGFVIPGKRILTNAHVVADHTFVLVRRHGSPTKYRAEVQAVGHDCDLAILVVESGEFWEGMNFLELGDIPFLQEAVAVVGYPQGGDNISVTKGVVSRVEPTQYVHGATQLMAIQIDAAINPGNSGGPAIMGNKVAGVAFQNLSGAENIGI